MHALKNYNLVQATLSSIIIVIVVSGSITSRCSGNEPALLGEVQESGENRAHGSISVLFNCLTVFINYGKFHRNQYKLPAVSRLARRGEQWLHVCNIYTNRSQERLEEKREKC